LTRLFSVLGEIAGAFDHGKVEPLADARENASQPKHRWWLTLARPAKVRPLALETSPGWCGAQTLPLRFRTNFRPSHHPDHHGYCTSAACHEVIGPIWPFIGPSTELLALSLCGLEPDPGPNARTNFHASVWRTGLESETPRQEDRSLPVDHHTVLSLH